MSKEQQKESGPLLKVNCNSPLYQMAVTTGSPRAIRKSVSGKATQSALGTMETQTQTPEETLQSKCCDVYGNLVLAIVCLD